MKISRPLYRKAKILWQLENLQNYKDLYGKPLERDWRAKRLLLVQIILISNAHKNSPLKGPSQPPPFSMTSKLLIKHSEANSYCFTVSCVPEGMFNYVET